LNFSKFGVEIISGKSPVQYSIKLLSPEIIGIKAAIKGGSLMLPQSAHTLSG
jgi:hypothetical protein